MTAKAIVRDGIVENVIELVEGSRWQPPKGTTLIDVDANCTIGSRYEAGAFVRPENKPPQTDPLMDRLAKLEAEIADLKAART